MGRHRRLALVPDLMGSSLWAGDQLAWPCVDALQARGGRLWTEALRVEGPVPDVYEPLRRRLAALGPVEVLAWDWRDHLPPLRDALARRLRAWLLRGPAALPAAVVAHGVGGMLTWAALVQDPGLASQLGAAQGRVLLLGLPWAGCGRLAALARGEGRLWSLLSSVGGDPARLAELLPAMKELAPLREEVERGWDAWRAGQTRHGALVELHLVQGGGTATWPGGGSCDGDGRVAWLSTPMDRDPADLPGTALPGGVGRWCAQASHGQILSDPGLLDATAELIAMGSTQCLEQDARRSTRARTLAQAGTDRDPPADSTSLACLAVAGDGPWPPPPRRPLRLRVVHLPDDGAMLPPEPDSPTARAGFLSVRQEAQAILARAGAIARAPVDAAVASLGPRRGLQAWVEGALLAARLGDLREVQLSSPSVDLVARLRVELPRLPACLGLALEPGEELLIDAGPQARGRPLPVEGPAPLRLEPVWEEGGLAWTAHGSAAGLSRWLVPGVSRSDLAARAQRVADSRRGTPPGELPLSLLLPEPLHRPWQERDQVLLLRSEHRGGDDPAGIPWEVVGPAGAAAPGLSRSLVRQLRVDTAPATRAPQGRALVIVAARVPGARPLERARVEAQAVAHLLRLAGIPTTVVQVGGHEALREALADPAGTSIIHVISHGLVAPSNQELGALLLTDGKGRPRWLLPGELRFSQAPPRLLVLNACEVGSTIHPGHRASAFLPLARAVMQAGVAAFVGAAWTTLDTAAAAFGEAFYRALLIGQEPFGQALLAGRRAAWQVAPDDSTWAAFQGYGDPRSTPVPCPDCVEAPASWEDWAARLEALVDRLQGGDTGGMPALDALSDVLERPGRSVPVAVRGALARAWLAAGEPARAARVAQGCPALAPLACETRALAAMAAWLALPDSAGLAGRAPVQAELRAALDELACLPSRPDDVALWLLQAELCWLAARPGLVADPAQTLATAWRALERVRGLVVARRRVGAEDPALTAAMDRLRSAMEGDLSRSVPLEPGARLRAALWASRAG
ncbi:CHAT domain-containing protein [Myxococcota bacterium]|nr:CHAT domain-containing protein [Myxococcota bacterium]